MLSKLGYSIVWLIALIYAFGVITHHEGPWWDIAYALVFVAIIIQLCLVLYNASDVMSRRRMWRKLRGDTEICPHGAHYEDCPDCRH